MLLPTLAVEHNRTNLSCDLARLPFVGTLMTIVGLVFCLNGAAYSNDVLDRTLLTCKVEPKACYDSAVTVLKIYRELSIKNIQEKTAGYRLPSAPFALLHPQRTKHSVLLVHGLNDSPYYLKDIAEVLHKRGMNVVSILLPGHGLTIEEMHKVEYRQWLRELNWGLRLAAQLGDDVLVGGFSTGGVLATTAVVESKNIKGLLLFAPAIEVQGPMNLGNRAAILTCLNYVNRMSMTTDDLEENPIKYTTRSANSVCQLDRLLSNLYYKIGHSMYFTRTHNLVKALAQKITIPTYLVMTTEDHRVPADSVLSFAENIAAPKRVLVYTPDPSKVRNFAGLELVVRSIQHSYLVLKTNEHNRQVNPSFAPVERSLNEFLDQNYSN